MPQSYSVCSRCGAQIKHTFRVGDFIFGSECVSKVDESLMKRLYGERLQLGEAIQAWAEKRMKSRAKGVDKNITIEPDDIPEVGTKVKWGDSNLIYTVEGYTVFGIRVSAVYQYRKFFNDVPFEDARKLVALEEAHGTSSRRFF